MEEEIIIIETDEEQEIVIIENDIEYIKPTTQEKIIIPSKEQQIIVPDDGVFALSKVTIEPISSEYIKPNGTKEITENGEYDITEYKKANVNIGGVSKGLVINEYDSDGYAIDISIVGLSTIPRYYCASTNSNYTVIGKIKKVTLSNDVTYIAAYAFSLSAFLEEVICNSETLSTNNLIFQNCSNLTKVIFPNLTEVFALSSTAIFKGTPILSGTGYIYVPDSLVDSFKSATNWSAIADQIKGVSEL